LPAWGNFSEERNVNAHPRRYRDGLARTDVITTGSALTDRQDATFTVRAGLADSSCFTLESVNYPGRYLRHAGYRLQTATNDGTTTFQQDATFCAQPGLNGGGDNVSLESFNYYPGYHWRHYAEAVYVATNGGGNAWDAAGGYNADATWNNAAPLG
jgi:hypothetical protein